MRLLPIAVAVLWVTAPDGRAADAPKRDREVEQAVGKALTFLKETQKEDGSWSIARASGSPSPPVTALCVLAFLSSGHAPGEGDYGNTIEKGLRCILKRQQDDGLIASQAGHEMYHHGICTLALAKAAAATKGPLRDEMRKALDRSVAVILKAQRKEGLNKGGWRYKVNGYDTDLSVTGWQLLALHAARDVGCEIPAEAIERAREYVERCRDSSTGGFRYLPGSHVTATCTAVGILALETAGKEHHRSDDVLKAADFLLKRLPQRDSAQFSDALYFGSQAMFRVGERRWKSYREHLHKVLLADRGDSVSWESGDAIGNVYGPNYTTAMAILALTAEDAYRPIDKRREEPAEKDK
jgi:hypothetical protein